MGPWSREKGPGPEVDFDDRLRAIEHAEAAGAEMVEEFRIISEDWGEEWLYDSSLSNQEPRESEGRAQKTYRFPSFQTLRRWRFH